jgi:hypothetical protein
VLSSWWTWWYGGGYGMRAMIQFYAFMSFGLAAFYQFAQSRISFKIARNIIATMLIALSLFQSYQYKKVYIHWDSMSRKSYWIVFGKLSLTEREVEDYNYYLEPPDYEQAKEGVR